MPRQTPPDDAHHVGEWIFHLNVARRACHLYAVDHPATEPAKLRLIEETDKLPDHAILLQVTDDGFGLAGAELGEAAAGGGPMARQLVQLGIVAIGLRPPIPPESVDRLLAMLAGLTDRPTEAHRREVLRTAAGIQGVHLVPIDVDWFVFSEGLAANLALEGGLWSDLVESVAEGRLPGATGRSMSPREMADLVNGSDDPRAVMRLVLDGVVELLDGAAASSAMLDGLILLAAVERMIGRLRSGHQRHLVRMLLPACDSANPLRRRLVDAVPADHLVDGAESMLEEGSRVPTAVTKKVTAIAEGQSQPFPGAVGGRSGVGAETVRRARELKKRLLDLETEEEEPEPVAGVPYHHHPAVIRGCDDHDSRDRLLRLLGDHETRRHTDLILRSVQMLWPESKVAAVAADRLVRRFFERLELGEFGEAEVIAAALQAVPDQTYVQQMTGTEGLTALLDAVSIWGKEHRAQVSRIASRLGQRLVPAILSELETEEQLSRRRRLMEMIIAIGPQAAPYVRRLLDDHRWFVVRNAILLLRRLRDPDVASHFTKLIEHDDPRVVAEVIRAMASSGDPRWLQGLQRLFLLEHPRAGKEAVTVAMQLRRPEVGRLLLQLLQRSRGAHLRDDHTIELINALGGFPQPEVVEELDRLASLSHWRDPFRLTPVWEAAARAAARHERPESDRVLEKIASLKDPAAELARKLLVQRREGSS